MPYSTTVKTKRDGKITLSDGTGVPITLEVAYEGEGSFSSGEERSERIPIYDRGTVVGVRRGNDAPFQTATFEFNLRALTDDTHGSVIDFIMFTNTYSTNTSTSNNSDFKTVDVEYFIEGTALGDDHDYKYTMTQCVGFYTFTEGTPSTVSITFECYGTVSRTTA